MALLNKTLIVGQAWLTAAMTLVAGMPHFSCACPDGTVKPVCVKITIHSSDSCCAATCCSRAERPSKGQKTKSCCSPNSRADTGTSDVQRISIGRSCCTRAFAQPQAPAMSHVGSSVVRDYDADASLPSLTLDLNSRQQIVNGPKPWQAHAGSPPTDFLALFRHYVI